ncbi:P-loop containing nucleoside triphosphate hydrolases superfamily protein [Euphorbia peplus]|nr:P-loop containing nucleoside triphosphate hydrolases superfamily protein [Euphorbia peplus]
MEERGSSSSKKKAAEEQLGFSDIVFAWSLEDVFNEDLFKVEKIPDSFESSERYFDSYKDPLLEESRAQICSSMEVISGAPFAEVTSFSECKPRGSLLYEVKVDQWKNKSCSHGKEPYRTLPGDIVILVDAKPETVSDLQRKGRTWTFALVNKISNDDNEDATTSTQFKVQAAKEVEVSDGMWNSLFVIFLTNITTNKRIWSALNMEKNPDMIKEVLSPDYTVTENYDRRYMKRSQIWDENITSLLSTLNESQIHAVLACLHKVKFNNKPYVELIWGPPGTGKTKTVSVLLFSLLRMRCRTLTCAPTNVAITEVATRVLKLVRESHAADASVYSVGDILLFGNKERLKVNSEVKKIYLDYRVERLIECFAPMTGWQNRFTSTIRFFEDCVSEYYIFLENELIIEKDRSGKSETTEEQISSINKQSFLEFARERFQSSAMPLRDCLLSLCTHIPETYIRKHNIANVMSLVCLLDDFGDLLFRDDVTSEALEESFSHPELVSVSSRGFRDTQVKLHLCRKECLSLLKTLHRSLNGIKLPSAMNKYSIIKFCFETASLIFCTASSSYKLHRLDIEPLDYLVIDEAAQLKECESLIPLQLWGINHAILIGDECQLPAMVESNLSGEAGFGRSLFERLSSLGHPKHLLNMQYRMHPSISHFPNSKFYLNNILDAPNVLAKSYTKQYLPGPMFGPYSFINVFGGREEKDDVGHSRLNTVEVAIVLKLVKTLYKAWNGSKESISIGVISPYAAQVAAVHEKLDQKFKTSSGFSVKVRSVDGFQGGEEDIIIMSTVRANRGGAIGFMSNYQRINVALTRARHCLWILGNERTLINSESTWTSIVNDAKNRNCFFNVDQDKELAKTILEVKKEFDQLDDLLNGDSVFFRNRRWKVLFSENFRKSFGKLASVQAKTTALNYILRLSSGWRPKKRNADVISENFRFLRQFKVAGLYVICSVDIVKEKRYIQVLKVWDILRLDDIPKLIKRLNGIFERYTDDFISRCNEKLLEGDFEIPMTWTFSTDIVRYKILGDNGPGRNLNSDDRCYVENSKVSDSLLLMKFYNLSSGVVSHLLSDGDGRELELPFEVTDEEMEIIFYQRSTFILGRSGTGKTTVLTMKLFKKEQLYHLAIEGYNVDGGATFKNALQQNNAKDDNGEMDEPVRDVENTVLRQLFVTVSPKLCFAVKQQVSQLKSFVSGGEYSACKSSVDMEDIDNASRFQDIPDSFISIPTKAYPLVITFHKFLMMLDGTIGNSYFERFPDVRELLCDKTGNFSGSILVQTFIKTKEVNFEKFCSSYSPHFNSKLTKKLDFSRVFTEIMSRIKGGLHARVSSNGRLSREDYVVLAEGRISTLNKHEREMIYDAYEDYEKMKMENGDFDMADIVIDLHRRLGDENYGGDMMDFVYIDEVQDLTMSQVALFKHISKNVKEGFVFSGDTAQTIARGIDFRFEDIRSLFYDHFIMGSNTEGNDRMKEKGHISKIFHLSQNFRTHAGVLKLAQSVIDLLYRFFPTFIDILSHETSLIFGEAPILLESGNDENAIVTIFGNQGNVGSKFVGFGAEQVILVRDDNARKEISKYVGKQALVLTIVECKGLEFQDVLLYNFFGTSLLRNKWRVLYEYMSEQCLLDASTGQSFPRFNPSKYNVLCSELKQLYVAITRTRQRLWICENSDEFSKPMFDYWRKKGLVQVRKLDDSVATAMQVASSPEEWKSQGYKLLREHNYEMATMCFERAGDEYGEKLAKAAGLKASADKMHASNPEMAFIARRQAAEIFETIGKDEYAAECFFLLKEYERAGKIYLKCGESSMEKAGECLYLAGCYEFAAEVYANGKSFSKCLKACSEGRLFEKGLNYIQCWKQSTDTSKEIDRTEQEFLERCAVHYHELKDNRTMMKYVRAFDCMASIRNFLEKLGCVDELLSFEEESGNFLEAAKIAKMKGELLREADLVAKAGNSKDASLLILWYVFARSLWSSKSKGWPLKQFSKKGDLLAKAKGFAKSDSEHFYEFVHMEAEILLNDPSSLSTLRQHLDASRVHKSTRGEILSARKILDLHLKLNCSKYGWEDHMIHDIARFSEGEISMNRVSTETLVYFWNFWKDNIVNIFKYLRNPDVNDDKNYSDFCLNYMGVRRQFHDLNPVYNLMIPDANWVNELDSRSIRRNGKFVSLDVHQFASPARSYWSSELLAVGTDILVKLEALYNLSVKNSSSLFCQSRHLCHIYTIANFMLSSKFLDRRFHDNKALQKFVELPTQQLFRCVYPLDLKESWKENMSSLRRTENIGDLVKEVTCEAVCFKKSISYGQLGRILVAILGCSKLDNQLFEKIIHGCRSNPSWMALINDLCKVKDNKSRLPGEQDIMWKLHGVIQDIYEVNWRKAYDYISPECFLYLIERQLILVSCIQGHLFTTRSSFSEMLVYMEHDGSSISWLKEHDKQHLTDILDLLTYIVEQFLLSNKDTKEWTKRSHANAKDCNAAVTLRLVIIACMMYLNFGCYRQFLFEWLGRNYISNQLPSEFVDALNRRRKHRLSQNVAADIEMFSEAFKKMGNPVVVVSLGENHAKWLYPDAIHLDMINQSKEEMWTALFPNTNKKLVESDADIACSSLASLDLRKNSPFDEVKIPSRYGLMKMLKSLQPMNNEEDKKNFIASVPEIMASVQDSICIFTSALCGSYDADTKNGEPYREASVILDELKQLYCALHMREPELTANFPRIGALLNHIESKMPRMGSILDELFLQQDEILEEVVSETCHHHEQGGTSEDATQRGSSSQANLGNQANISQAGNKEKGTGKSRKKSKGKRKGNK